jgi:RNA polymerase sigma-70 factor (ECF subfamily)
MAAEDATVGGPVAAATATTLEDRFRSLLEQHRPALARLAASYTRTASDRDDLLQEIAIALWRALPSFRGDCSERTFLFRIAHNRCLALLSRRSPAERVDPDGVDVEDPAPSAEAQLSREQQSERLVQAIRALPLIYRQVITLALEGVSYKEIAQILGIGESNVGVRLNRARQMLKASLEVQP